MRIKSNLSTLMGLYRYNIKAVHERTGLARGTISNLYYDRAARADFDTLSKLCTLFNCDIGTLLIIEDGEMDNTSAVGSVIIGGNENE